ncbi:hypothetical protein DFH09DRAFT_1093874 [Mycena vulgaris]|nr:hypothetical protein DFH09DRAFT_1093874 [Mycena vulgaris]
MSEMRVFRLLRINLYIELGSEADQHDDLPADMEMFPQLRGVIQASGDSRAEFVEGEPCGSFLIIITRKMRGIRLRGYVLIVRDNVLESVEEENDFRLQFTNVNPDGFPLCSVPHSQSIWAYIQRHCSERDLCTANASCPDGSRQYRDPPARDRRQRHNRSPTSIELWAPHQRLLLLSYENERRTLVLSVLGDIWVTSYKITQVTAIPGAGVVLMARKVEITPDNDLHKSVQLNALGNSLLLERLADIEDVKTSVSAFRQLTQDTNRK